MKNLVSKLTVENVFQYVIVPGLVGLFAVGFISLVGAIVLGDIDLANASFGGW